MKHPEAIQNALGIVAAVFAGALLAWLSMLLHR